VFVDCTSLVTILLLLLLVVVVLVVVVMPLLFYRYQIETLSGQKVVL
jgi:hypothetical protein